MSVQSRAPTQQYHNRFAKPNSFQSTRKPQFVSQKLFNVEYDKFVEQEYYNTDIQKEQYDQEMESNKK